MSGDASGVITERAAAEAGLTAPVIVAITGATGVIYGVRLLEILKSLQIATHLIISDAGAITISEELGRSRREVEELATEVHKVRDVGASIASGSFQAQGMVIAPCSMKTLAAIAHGYSDGLITRAADVTLKERRRLILMVRETPFNLVHLKNMTGITEMGGVIFPPLPAFYQHPKSIQDMVDHTLARVLDLLNVHHAISARWDGI